MSSSEDAEKYRVENWQPVQGQVVGNYATVHIHTAPVYKAPPTPSTPPERIWTVPFQRNRLFLGQEDLLVQLHNHLTRGTPTAVSGLGGIGKTQVAIEYAYRYQETYPFVFWIRAEHLETLMTDLVSLASLLQLAEQDDSDQMKVVDAVKQWLTTHPSWLLILDNVDDLALLSPFLPERHPGAILLTTRASQTQPLAEPLFVEQMGEHIGAEFLLRRARILLPDQPLEKAAPDDQLAARQMCQLAGGLPLALDQAGAYIDETQCRIQDYLTFYQQNQQLRTRLLQQRGKVTTGHAEPVATTWALAFTRVEQASLAAAELLRACAFLAPDLIPEDLLRQGAGYWGTSLKSVVDDSFLWNETIRELLKYALVRRSRELQALSIHRLVQAVLKDAMDLPVYHQWAQCTIQAVDHVFPHGTDPTMWPMCKRLIPHVQACAELIENHDIYSREAVSLLHRAGNYLCQHARYGEAEPMLKCALSIREQQLGATHPDTAESLNDLAGLYSGWGKYAEAEPLYQRALSILEQQVEPNHPNMASLLHNLALLYLKQGKYAKAEPLYQRALVIREQQLGVTHPDIIESLNDLAELYMRWEKYVEAEHLLKRALAIREQQVGAAHPDTAHSLNNLAQLYHIQKKYAEAEPLLKRALSIREQQLGATHPDTAESLNNLAELYKEQGKYAEAEPLYQRVLEIREQQLGPQHLDTADSLNDLAVVYYRLGKYKEAEPLLRRALSIRERQLGSQHLDITYILDNLADLYEMQGEYVEAELLLKRALAIREQQLGPQHPDTANSLNNLASLYFEQGKYAEAESLFKRTLLICEQQLGPRHLHTATCLHNLASAYVKQDKYREAEPLHQRALAIREQQLGPQHPDIANSLYYLATLYESQGKYREAEQLYQRTLAIYEQRLGPHPETVGILLNLANLYVLVANDRGKYREAEQLYQRALAICEQQLGPQHPLTALCLADLSILYDRQGKYTQAEQLLKRALAICERTLGPENTQTQSLRQGYISLLRKLGRNREAKKLEEGF